MPESIDITLTTVNPPPVGITIISPTQQPIEVDLSKAGPKGLSAYQIALANGFVGTEAAWLASLVGADGSDGINGQDGAPGADGTDGTDGSVWYTGAGAPGFTANPHDLYLNTLNGDVYEFN